MRQFLFFVLCLISIQTFSQANPKLLSALDQQAKALESKVIDWRRHFHQNPELSNREFKTGAKIAEHLQSLGLEVRYPVAKTGAVGILRTGKPGPVLALRADIDGLPVVERNSLPFASKAKSEYQGQEVGVMHACGHDTHIAILMGAAEILTKNKNDLKGTIVFLFQPAEEGAPDGEEGGAALMIKEGALENPKVEAAFGLHINSLTPVGTITYRPEGEMAAVDNLNIKLTGRQTHGAAPWNGADPIVAAAQIVTALQTIVSRNLELTNAAAVVTIGKISGGVRRNIIPETVEMQGTIRTLDSKMQDVVHARIKEITENIATGMGVKADVEVTKLYPVTYNDPKLTAWAAPFIERVTGKDKAKIIPAATGAEDFSFYAQKVPGFFFFVGGMPLNADKDKTPSHHTPDFYIDESGMLTGLRAMLGLTAEYLYKK
ncbi:MAG: amidohydrolase [Flammeovirgaceae bacterium]|jgi:amidohydrolase|nr:amidohydrolase [Flammeovirgaceae bacterium]MCZ8070909.1 amidohydrolase [Cytophagales bacterium]